MDTALKIIITAQDKASAVLDNFKGNMEKMEPTFKKMATAGTVAFGAIAAVAGTSLKAFAGAEAEMAIATKSVENSLKSLDSEGLSNATEGASNLSQGLGYMKDVMEQVGTAAINLGFDDEAAASSFAKLFSASKDTSKAIQEQKIAMDLARYSGQSLESATDALMKVHAGGTRVLKDFGIEVAEGTTAVDAFRIIQERTAGSAKTFSETTAGAMEILQNQVGNLKETVGEALAPAFSKLLETLAPLIEKFTAWAEKNPELLGKIILIGGAVAALVAGIGLFGLVLPGIITGFTAMAAVVGTSVSFIGTVIAGLLSPIGLVVAAVTVATLLIIKNWDAVRETLVKVWEGMKSGLRALGNFFISIAEGFANSWVGAVNFIIKALNKIQFSIPDWVPKIGGKSFGINIPLMEQVSLPKFEQGGIVPGARGSAVPIIAHGGEEIIPARNVRNGGGLSVNITMNYPSFATEQDVDVVRAQMETAMRDIVRNYKLQPL